MRDEIDGRLWTDHHASFADSVDYFFDAIRLAFCKLNRIQFDAPWRKTENC